MPSSVRYDTGLPPNAKLLYAEISSLTDATGYCFATNAYFEKLYELSDRTIIRLLKALESAGYIRIENNVGGKDQRRIYSGVNPLIVPPDKNVTGGVTKMSPPPDKNVTPINNKKYNKKDNNNTKASRRVCEHEPEMFERFWRCYPRHEDKEKARREWDNLKADRELMQTMSAALDRAKRSEDWQRGIGIPYACRWLKYRRWEDELLNTETERGGGWADDPEVMTRGA